MKKGKRKFENRNPWRDKKVYLSGPIAAYGLTRAKQVFKSAKAEMNALGFENVVTPFENGLSDDAPYEQHMKADIKMLQECDIVCMLLRWQESNGAKKEYEAAEAYGKIIIYQTKARV